MDDLAKKKKIIYTAIIIVILLVVSVFIALQFPSRSPTPSAGQPGVTGRLPGTSGDITQEETTKTIEDFTPSERIEIGLVRITDFAVLAPSLNSDETKILFYKKDGGDLIATDLDGAGQEKLSNLTIVGMMEGVWSPSRDRAVVRYLDGQTIKSFIHIGTSSAAVMPQNITGAAWSPDGRNLAYAVARNGILEINITDSDGRNARVIHRTPFLDAIISWPSANFLAFATPPSGVAESYLFTLPRAGGAMRRIAGPLFGLMPAFSPNSSRILISTTDARGKSPRLEVRSATGTPITQINLGTFADKCVWLSETEIVCAVPFELPDQVFPDSHLRGEINTQDILYKIDLDAETINRLEFFGSFNITDLISTSNRKTIFFIDKNTGFLWRLRLSL